MQSYSTMINMSVSTKLNERCQGLCELCTTETAMHDYAVSPRNNDVIENEVALCDTCLANLDVEDADNHWQCLAGSIWNAEPSCDQQGNFKVTIDMGKNSTKTIQYELKDNNGNSIYTDSYIVVAGDCSKVML